MLLSVFNWNTLDYDYYDTPNTSDYGGWFELQGLGVGGKEGDNQGVGIDIEDALPSLPSNATFAGTGPVARGRICVKRDTKDRGEAKSNQMNGLGAVFPSSRLVNLQTLPPHARVKFHQDWDQPSLDYSGANLLKPPASLHSNALQGLGYTSESAVPIRAMGQNDPPPPTPPRELPLALFIVPVLAGSLAGYFAASRSEGIGKKLASMLGFLGGLGAGIALGREYEGYKMSTINAIAVQQRIAEQNKNNNP